MSFKSFVAAAIGVAALSVAAPAAALTLTFAIDVTGASDGAPAVADFQQTWTFDPVESSTSSNHRYRGPATGLIETPQTDDLLAAVGLTGQPLFSNQAGASTNTFIEATSVDFFQNVFLFDDSTSTFREWRQSLSLQSPTIGIPLISYDDAGLVDFILTYGPMSWSEQAIHTVGGVFESDPPAQTVFSRSYTGTATLVSVNGVAVGGGAAPVPEPASWGLMILGFGAAGAMLRRRTPARVRA